MAVVAAAAFTTLTAAAHADVMTAGTWDGKVTGGTLSIGDGDLQSIAVPAGDPFVVTVPATGAPAAFRAPATHIPIQPPPYTYDGAPGTWTASGSLDVSRIDGTVDAATGAITGSANAHGILRLDFAGPGGSSSFYCQLGDTPSPAPPSPFALDLVSSAPWSAATGAATLTDSTFALRLNCGAPWITDDLDLEVVGHPVMPSGTNTLSLTIKFTRRADPPPPATVTTTKSTNTVTAPPVQCVVPKLKGLKLRKARAAAEGANCAVGKVKRKRSGKKRTTVLKQGKAAGTVLAQGARIKLTVAK